jgi:hypothetical protein
MVKEFCKLNEIEVLFNFYAVPTGLHLFGQCTQASVRCAHCDLGYNIPVLWTSEPSNKPLKNTVLKHKPEVRRTEMLQPRSQ